MRTVKVESNFGRFAYTAETSIGEEVNEETAALAVEGMQSVCFRAGGSDAEKALETLGFKAKEQKRGDVEFSEKAMAALQKAFDTKIDAICKKKGFPGIVIRFTGEHVFGETDGGGSRKRATEHVDTLLAEKEVNSPFGKITGEQLLRMSLAMFNPAAADADRAKLIEICHEGMFATKRGGAPAAK